MNQRFKDILKSTTSKTAQRGKIAEYVLLIGLVSIGAIAAILGSGGSIAGSFERSASALNGAYSSTPSTPATPAGPQIAFGAGPFGGTGSVTIDEDDLGSEGLDTPTGSDGSDPSSAGLALTIDYGSSGAHGSAPYRLAIPPALTSMSLASTGTPLTFSLSGDQLTLTAQAGGADIFVVTTDGISITTDLRDVLDHSASGDDVLASIPVSFVAQNAAGTTTSATFEINVRDDVPMALDDLTVSVSPGGSVGTGFGNPNLISNDTPSADGAPSISQFTYTNGSGLPATAAAGSLVTTQFGSLQVNSDGSWSYTANGGAPTTSETFTYSLTDADGVDTSAAIQVISIL